MDASPSLLEIWTIVILASIGTFMIRFSFFLLFSTLGDIPPLANQALRFVPVAVFSALILPRLVFVDGDLMLTISNGKLLAGCVAGVVAWRTESIAATLGTGMLALWIFDELVIAAL